MRRISCDLSVCISVCLVGAVSFCAAQEGAARSSPAVRGYLERNWEIGIEPNLKSDEEFAVLEASAGGNAEIFYARALVCWHQRRSEEALKALDRAIALAPEHMEAHRAKTYLTLLTRNYGGALAASEKLAGVLKKHADDKSPAAEEAVILLGSIFGFLEGPASGAPAAATHETVEKRVLATLGAERAEAFKNARQDVLEKFTSLTSSKATTQEKEIAEEEAEKQRDLAAIASQRERVEERGSELEKRREKLASELRTELEAIDRDDRPLVSALARLEAQASAVQRDFNNAANDLNRLQARLAGERDRFVRDQIGFDIDRLNVILGRIDAELGSLNRQAAGLQAQRATLIARRQRAEGTIGAEIKGIDRELSGLSGQEKKLNAGEKKALKTASGYTPKVRSLSVTAGALTTYLAFPLEAERTRLMDAGR